MTATVRPRRCAHRGSVVACGFAIDVALVGAAEARRRVLAAWQPGAVVRAYEGLLVVTGLRPTRVQVELAPGAPLVAHHGVVASAPLEADEASVLAPTGADAIAFVRGGVARTLPAGRDAVVDVATWIDLDGYAIAEVAALAPPPARAEVPPPLAIEVRAATGVAAAPAAAADARAALARTRAAAGTGGAATATAARPPSLWRRIAAWLGRPASTPTSPGAVLAPPRPSWLRRLRDRIAVALWRSRLARALGRRHAAYLRHMLELFDRGELDEALRHAIPLGGGGEPGAPPLGAPRPRDTISLAMVPAQARASLSVDDLARELIRDRYRAALARLEQLDRIEDAAFVYADLLGDVAAAVALLERHQRYELAARLADGHELEPGLAVRLWWLAGDRDRAIAVARRHAAWADAVARLERAGDARAKELRLRWADHLAAAGDYVRAIDAAGPHASSYAYSLMWIELGIATGGHAAARLLVAKLSLAPARYPDLAPALGAILDDDGPDGASQRVALARALVATTPGSATRTIARAAARALLADAGRGEPTDAARLVPQLVQLADDAALRVDQPPIQAAKRPPPLAERDAPIALRWAATDAGTITVHDAAALPGGGALLALGELGVRIVGRDGRAVVHFDQPATRLAIADHGTRALAWISRGEARRIVRLDLAVRRATRWCDASFDRAARSFDGDLWLVTRERELLAIDANAPGWKAAWGVELSGLAGELRRDGHLLAVEAIGDDETQLWCYEKLVLRARKPLPTPDGLVLACVPRPAKQDVVETLHVPADSDAEPRFALLAGGWMLPLEGAPLVVDADATFAAVAIARRDGVTITVGHIAKRIIIATLALEGAERVGLRVTNNALVAWDDRGRVLELDLVGGKLRRDLRVTV